MCTPNENWAIIRVSELGIVNLKKNNHLKRDKNDLFIGKITKLSLLSHSHITRQNKIKTKSNRTEIQVHVFGNLMTHFDNRREEI